MFSRPAALAALFLTTAFAQEFEVASVRVAAHDGQIENYTPSLNVQPGRNINFANISLRDLIALAYGLGIRQISGPDWLRNRETEGATLAAVCRKLTTAEIAQQIQTLAPGYFRDGPIVDRTGLKGFYDFKLEWITRAEANRGSTGPTMFDALERQLGLKLNSRKEPVENLIVDHAEKEPTEN